MLVSLKSRGGRYQMVKNGSVGVGLVTAAAVTAGAWLLGPVIVGILAGVGATALYTLKR